MTFDAHDAAAYVQIRVRDIEQRIRGTPPDTKDESRVALIATISEKFPDVGTKKTLRHKIIMALLGKSITSQNELKWHETRTLLEVLHDQDFDGSCWRELQMAVEVEFTTEPWLFPATRLL